MNSKSEIRQTGPTGRIHWLDVATLAVLGVALVLAFFTPPEATQGEVARILYIHAPAAWVAYLAFGVTLVGSGVYLVTNKMVWDRLAAASAEVGVVFTGLTIALGMIWAKPTWGVWWTWDARLTLTAIMFFVYLGYLALRRAIADPVVRARRSAVLGMLAIVQIPIVHFSVIWWRGLHQPPTVLRPDEMQIDGILLVALLVGLGAYTLVYAALARRRMALAVVEATLDEVVQSNAIPVAGDAVLIPTAPAESEETP